MAGWPAVWLYAWQRLITIPLQVDNDTELHCYTNETWSLLDSCVLPDLVGASGGEATFNFLLGLGVIGVCYIGSGRRLGAASVLTVLLGGFVVPSLPGNFQTLTLTLVTVGIAAGILAFFERYMLNPGVEP